MIHIRSITIQWKLSEVAGINECNYLNWYGICCHEVMNVWRNLTQSLIWRRRGHVLIIYTLYSDWELKSISLYYIVCWKSQCYETMCEPGMSSDANSQNVSNIFGQQMGTVKKNR